MPQKLLYNFPIHAFIIFKGTTKNRIATAIIYSCLLYTSNPQEHGYDHNVIKAALEKGAKLLYWCMADEVGQEETYHIHLFLVYENPVMFTTLKNKFPTAHIEVPQWGKNSENYAYIRKEGAKYNKDANGHYKYTDSKGKVHELSLIHICSCVADFGAGTLTLPNGAVEHYEEDVNERYLREMNYFLDYAAGEETESLNPPATALQVLKLTLGEQQ